MDKSSRIQANDKALLFGPNMAVLPPLPRDADNADSRAGSLQTDHPDHTNLVPMLASSGSLHDKLSRWLFITLVIVIFFNDACHLLSGDRVTFYLYASGLFFAMGALAFMSYAIPRSLAWCWSMRHWMLGLLIIDSIVNVLRANGDRSVWWQLMYTSMLLWGLLSPAIAYLGAHILKIWTTLVRLAVVGSWSGLLFLLLILTGVINNTENIINAYFYFSVVPLMLFLFLPWIESSLQKYIIMGGLVECTVRCLSMQRNRILMCLMVIAVAGITAVLRKSRNQVRNALILVVVVPILIFSVYNILLSDVVLETFGDSFLSERFVDLREKLLYSKYDRGELPITLWTDLSQQGDLTWGRGLLGTYYYEGSGEDEAPDRLTIECAYLYLLLKGGLVLAILWCLVMALAVWNGYFRSSNAFIKSCASVILLKMIQMYPFGLPCLDFDWVLTWLCVGACMTPILRRLNNDEIKQLLLPGKKMSSGATSRTT